MKRILILISMFFSFNAVFADELIQSDISNRQYRTGYLGHNKQHGQLYFSLKTAATMPDSLDLRTTGAVSKIKDQGGCGSCWAFAVTKALESARLKAGLDELDLSEQQVVSCDRNAAGCGGGNMDDADYLLSPGLTLESNYRYTASNSRCKSPLPAIADKAKSWAYIGAAGRKPTVDELKAALNTYGVIFVTVAAGGSDWGGSRVHMTSCGNRGTNHMVTLVGYNAQNEFIIGNSWGSDWAENGFAYAKAGCNMLAGESEGAAFVVYEGGPAPVPPHIRLPAEVSIYAGSSIPIGVHPENGTTYKWYVGTDVVGVESILWISPAADTVYKLVATNSAGTAESSVNVKVIAAAL